MTDKITPRAAGTSSSMDPHDRGPADRRRPDRGRQDRRGRAARSDADAEVIDATGQHRHPGLRRHPPAHLGGRRSAAARPNATLDDYFVEVLDTFAPRLPARGRVRGQPGRRAGVPQRRHHHAGRLVPHQQHARAPGRRDPGRCRRPASAPSTPTAARTPRWRTTGSTATIAIPGDDVRRIRDDVLLLRRRPAHDGRWPPAAPGFCVNDVVARRVGAGPRAGHPDHRARGDGPAGRPLRHGQAAATGSACSARTPPTSTAATSATRSGGWSPTPAARSRSRRRWRRRWATAGRR